MLKQNGAPTTEIEKCRGIIEREMTTYAERFKNSKNENDTLEQLKDFKPEDLGLRKAKLEEILQIYKKVLSKKESIFPEDKDK